MSKLITLIQKTIAAAKQFWASLPHPVQAGVLLFATTALTTLGKELTELFTGNEAFTWLMFRHDIAAAVAAGILVVRAFYMIPNGTQKQLQAVPSPVIGVNVPNLPSQASIQAQQPPHNSEK